MMINERTSLDQTYAALADPTRRAILAYLRNGPATVTRVAAPFEMSLHGVSKHVRVLERAGLIEREVRGRQHFLHLCATPLEEATEFTEHYRAFWEARLGAMAEHVENKHLESQRNTSKPKRPIKKRGASSQ